MKIIEKKLKFDIPQAPSDALFLDIETTGLKKDASMMYLFGCVSKCDDGDWFFKQWLIESPFDEMTAMHEICEYASKFNRYVTFNGDRFDLPYLDYRARLASAESPFLTADTLDLYKEVRHCKELFCLEGAHQKNFEAFIGNNREDKYNGKELIGVYYQYIRSKSDRLLKFLLLHNEEDVLGMLGVCKLLPYADLFKKDTSILDGAPTVIKQDDGEMLLQFKSACEYPYKASKFVDISVLFDDKKKAKVSEPACEAFGEKLDKSSLLYLSLDGQNINIKVPLFTGELKFFFPHARDYFYLPKEDMAIHKSVAQFVDSNFKEKATKETCYAKKAGTFFPLTAPTLSEVYKTSPDGQPYGLVTSEVLGDLPFWEEYIHDLFKVVKKG